MKHIQIKLNQHDLFDLTLTEMRTGGTISSTLSIPVHDKDFSQMEKIQYNSAIDALESLILAHACAGIDVESVGYVKGIETAVDSITAHYL